MAKTKSIQAQAAAAIRKDLKAAFPGTIFGVRSEAFAGGDAVDIEWLDGPTTDEVKRITGKYEVGRFDIMGDMYKYTNQRDNIPQVKYVQTHRGISRAAYADLVDTVNGLYGWFMQVDTDLPYNGIILDDPDPLDGHQSKRIWAQFCKTSYVHGDTPVVIQEAR